MAMSVTRRKRIIAVIFIVSLLIALFWHRKNVWETSDGREVGENSFSRFDWSNIPEAKLSTTSLPTKMYSVIELEEEEETMEAAQDRDEGTEQDASKMKAEKNEIEENFTDKVRTDNKRNEIGRTRGDKRERKTIEIEEKIASYEQGAKDKVYKRNKSARVKTEMRNIEVENQTRDEFKRVTKNKDQEFKEGKKRTQEKKIENMTKDNRKVSLVTLAPGFKTLVTTTNRVTRSRTIQNSRTAKNNWINKLTGLLHLRKRTGNTIFSGTNATQETSCKIPELDPFHPHILPLQREVSTDLREICRSMYPYTPVFKVVDNKLVLENNIKEADIVKSSIKLREIKRLNDEDFKYMKERNPFSGLPNLYQSNDIGQSDFFRLEYKINERHASDLYARVSPKLNIVERQTKIAKEFQEKGLPLNVLVIGFDSVSRANFVRKLPRVKSFLETELNTYFMKGMSIVGDATTPILTAMFTGKDETSLPEGRTSFGGSPIDNWPWIMKYYERQGYITLYAEDDPSVSAFNLRLEGFSKSPTHHYMRPFWLSLEMENERDEPGRCSKSESMVNHTLKYIKSFFDVYPTSKKFAFGFHSYLAHAHPNNLRLAEDDLMWFLRTFVDNGYLKDTMLIIMGDHGSRNGEYRETIQGKLEERLPWFSISLPSNFHRRFPTLTANLQNNEAIITSSFDVHTTLHHILTYPSLPSGEQTQSLFQKLSRNRTCKDAGIAEHWCPCFEWSPMDVNSKHVQSIAVSTVKLINSKLSQFPLLNRSCHKVSLKTVLHAITLQPNRKVQTFHSTDQDGDRRVNYGGRAPDLLRYQIIFTTEPNQAKYEVTAHVHSSKVTVNPAISRLNRYNDQPACIAKQYPHARKFCLCRT